MYVSPQRRIFFRHLNFKKCSRTTSFLTFSLPHVCLATAACIFFDISTYKSAPNTSCFVHFHFRMCLSPQGRAFFQHQHFTSKCAFCHSGVQFLISPLSSSLRARRFNRPTFRLTWHTNHWKNTAFRDFSNIWRGCIFFLLTLALLHLLSADLIAQLCFSTVHIVGSLLFKLPSNIMLYFQILNGICAFT